MAGKKKTNSLKTAKGKATYWKDNISFIVVEPRESRGILVRPTVYMRADREEDTEVRQSNCA